MSERPLRILHLSDTHLFGDGTLHYGVVDTTAALRSVLERASSIDGIDVVVASGDLSDDGSVASYEALRDVVGPWARERGAVVVWAMGNHDAPGGFEAVLGAREATVVVRGVRFVTVDSSVPGAGFGRVDAAQLDRLRAALEGAEDPPGGTAPHGSVVVVHHPPVPARSPLLAALELKDPQGLLDACAGGACAGGACAGGAGVRAILAGHYHHALTARPAGLPVIVAPGIANRSDPVAPSGHERADAGSGFVMVDLPVVGDPTVVVVPVPGAAGVPDGTELFDLGPDEVARIAALAGPPVPTGSAAREVRGRVEGTS